MKTVGIIAEYNPFHNGHAYHMEQAKKMTGADTCVVVMSGDFVQRGAPAVLDKYVRAETALRCGADLVLELPACFSCGSAEYFAQGAVSVLNRLGVVDALCFGSESADLTTLQALARILSREPEAFTDSLQKSLREGKNFAAARSDALIACMMQEQIHLSAIQNIYILTDAMSSPNNILGIEYLKALLTQNSSIKPYVLKRAGQEYHSKEIEGHMNSASALRSLLETTRELSILKESVPPEVYRLLEQEYGKIYPVSSEDFSLMLNYCLLSESDPSRFGDMTPDMAARIFNERGAFRSFSGWTDLLNTKQYTRTRVSRSLMQCLLKITRRDMAEYKASGYTGYARILGFKKERTDLLRAIKEQGRIPLISKMADAKEFLQPIWQRQLEQDVHAADLYRLAVYTRFGTELPNEYRRQLVILNRNMETETEGDDGLGKKDI